MDQLASTTTLDDVRRRIARASRGLNEENTKATLIEPVLRALGWDVEDFEEVQREFRVNKRNKSVDYALLVPRTRPSAGRWLNSGRSGCGTRAWRPPRRVPPG
ncbi:MAG TPA: hypothetical protein VJP77_04220 [Planctomycetota bacterium]|nr:hypothetical protein [Planctomycetota bacterium]